MSWQRRREFHIKEWGVTVLRQDQAFWRQYNSKSTVLRMALLLLLYALSFLSLTSACYIQNCPRGGKRALPELEPRQCMACGPGDQGRCVGPSICCGEVFGCMVASPQAARCVEEDYLPSPCEVGGRICGLEQGRCAAPGVCCDSEGCMLDPECVEDNQHRDVAQQNSGLTGLSRGELLLRMLQANRVPTLH